MLDFLRIMLTARCKTQRGASAVEYALLIAGVAVLIMVAAKTLGFTMQTVFTQENSRLSTPAN